MSACCDSLPFDDDAFHHVLSIDVIEHVPDEQVFVSELYRVTRPGGRITLSMPNKNLRMFPPFITNWVSKKWGHYNCNGYTEDEIRSFVPNGASIKTLHVREFWMRLLYFPLRIFWAFNSRLTRWLLKYALKLEKRTFKGEHGRLVVTIAKQG